MSAGETKYSKAHALGNVDLARNINPRLRGSIRREDPGANPEPHFTGLGGETLNIDVSPTGPLVINFVTDDLDDALALLNAEDPTNLKAFEEDGYVVIQNLNGGEKNYIEVTGGNAAALLGFVATPEAGSKSFAGELATAPPGRFKEQDNPQGTSYIAGDEDLTSSVLNRAIAGSVVEAGRIANDLDVLVPTVRELTGAVATHAGSGKKVVYVLDADLRIPVNGFGITGTTQTARELDSVVQILTTDDEPIIDIDQATERYARVLDIYAEAVGTGSPTLDNSVEMSSFGTPDGGSVFGPNISILNISSATSISQIRGDLLIATGATFQSDGVQPGNTAVIEAATNGDPFNHNGEFIVTEILTETIIAVRPKSSFEGTFITTEKPRELNANLPGGSNYGTVRVVVGDYVSAKNGVAFEVPSWVPNATNVKIRCVSAERMRNLGLGDLVRVMAPNQGSIIKEFKDHIIDAVVGRRHGAVDVDAPAVVGSPDSLTLGTVESQLAELLNHVNTLIAGNVSYGGGVAWIDGTTNPATTMEGQIDKMLTDLATVGGWGADKIQAHPVGLLLEGSIRTQLNQLESQWSNKNRTETIGGAKTFSQVVALDGGATVGAVGIDSSGDVEITSATKQFKTAPSADTLAGVVTATTPTDHNLLWEFTVQGSLKGRIYASNTGNDGPGIELTVNAVWGGASWSRDNDGLASSKLALSNDVVGIWTQLPAAGTFLESAWINSTDVDLSNFTNNFFGGLSVGGLASISSVLSLGGNLTGSEANAEIPRIDVVRGLAGSTEKTLVMQFGASAGKWRIYASDSSDADEAFELTYNARWNSSDSKWYRDDNGRNSANYIFEDTRLKIRYRASGSTDTWFNSSWDTEPYEMGFGTGTDSYFRMQDGAIIFESNGSISNPPAVGGYGNSLRAKNIVKCWGNWTLREQAIPLLQNGFNIQAYSADGSGFQVNWWSDFVDDDYYFNASCEYGNDGGIAFKMYHKQPSYIRFGAYKATTGAQVNLNDSEFLGHICVVAIGEQ